jgi:cellulose synthase (UDP-forming)
LATSTSTEPEDGTVDRPAVPSSAPSPWLTPAPAPAAPPEPPPTLPPRTLPGQRRRPATRSHPPSLPRSPQRPQPDDNGHVRELVRLSGGTLLDAPPSGPSLAAPVRRQRLRTDTFVPALPRRSRVLVGALTAGWLVSMVLFWAWWLRPEHRISWAGLLLNTALLLAISVQPAFLFLSANRLRVVNPERDVPPLRVAMVVTRAPSEPWPVARDTLVAMLGQRFPHPYDVWICDEDPTPEIFQWCAANGVRVSCRKDVAGYHRSTWPRRTKCKEGNLAYFYDGWGYEFYDVVAQFDCDHVPQPTYLAEMVRPFADPAVGYVAAPSVCDANAGGSWAARSRLFREAGFQGPFQAGHAGGLAPTCIGSHYAVRTQALRQIGGIGPELAEDFSTAFLLTSAGWQGAFALNALAHGDGPPTFAAMITQEFQWSRSLTTLLYDLSGRHLRRMSLPLRLRFRNTLYFYPLLAVTAAIGTLLPPIAAVTGVPWVRVSYLEFLLRWASVSGWTLLLLAVLRRRRLLRPRGAPMLSWEVWLSSITRWPWVLYGVAAATRQRIRPRPVTFKVTPKGGSGLEPLPTTLVLPMVGLSLLLSVSALLGEIRYGAAGYLMLCLLGSSAYLLAAFAVGVRHGLEIGRAARVPVLSAVRRTAGPPLLCALAAVPPLVLACLHAPAHVLEAVGW